MRLYMNTALVGLHRKLHIVMQSQARALIGGILRHEVAISTITPGYTATTVVRYRKAV